MYNLPILYLIPITDVYLHYYKIKYCFSLYRSENREDVETRFIQLKDKLPSLITDFPSVSFI